MGLKRGRILAESIRDIVGNDSRLGIATVQPVRAKKKCRIRSLRIEYFLTEGAIFIIEPDCCSDCELQNTCTGEFAEQIMQKQHTPPSG
jgi:hypothetical protein